MKRKDEKTRVASRETLREKWKREFLSRRVDAKGIEPIRLRIRTLQERRRARREIT